MHVVLNIEKLKHQAGHRTRGWIRAFANAEAADMYAAIDQLSAKLDRQVIKHKEKAVDHNHGSRERKHAHTKFE